MGGEIAGPLVRIGGLIAFVLGVFEVVKGLLLLALVQAAGRLLSGAWLLSSIFPELGWLLSLVPVSGAALAAAHIVAGAVYAAAARSLIKAPVPMPPEERDKWTTALAVLAAVAIILNLHGLLLALGLSLAGLLLGAAEATQQSAETRPN